MRCGAASTPRSRAFGVPLVREGPARRSIASIGASSRTASSLRFQSPGRPPRATIRPIASCSSRPTDPAAGELPGVRRGVPVREVAPGARPDHPRRRGPRADRRRMAGDRQPVREPRRAAVRRSTSRTSSSTCSATVVYAVRRQSRRLPHAANGVVIRSVFGGFAGGFRSGDASVSQVQSLDDLLAGVASGKIHITLISSSGEDAP